MYRISANMLLKLLLPTLVLSLAFCTTKESEGEEQPTNDQAKTSKRESISIDTSGLFLDTVFNWTKQDTIDAAEKWLRVEKLYVAYVNNRISRMRKRNSDMGIIATGTNSNIDSTVGDAYMKGFRYLQRTDYMYERLSWAVDLGDTTLAFFLKYLSDKKLNSVRAALAQYDQKELDQNNVRDYVLERRPNMIDRYTLVFGIPKPENQVTPTRRKLRTTYTPGLFCFEINGARFYDDWNDVWP